MFGFNKQKINNKKETVCVIEPDEYKQVRKSFVFTKKLKLEKESLI